MRALFLLFLTLTLFGDVRIATAANMSFALKALIKAFSKHYPHIDVHMSIASSGKLAAQILHGARYDIFLSANKVYANRLYEANKTLTRPIVYAYGELVFVSKKPVHSLKDILKMERIAMANPATAPYGVATKELLKRLGLYEKIGPHLVYGESIAQTLNYARFGVDGAFLAKSVLFAKKMPKFYSLLIDKRLYKPIEQAMVLLSPKEEAMRFFIFMLGKEAGEILRRYGYGVPQ